jgi:nitroreductase
MPLTFQKSVCDLIRVRQSARTHTGEAIEPAVLKQLTDACARLDRGLLGEAARFEIIEKPFVRGAKVRLGNYGLQKNPRYFFAGAVKQSEMARQSYGFLMEQLVLKATELGLGTCWIGFFDRKFFENFKVASDELFPAACTVGHAADRRLFEKISRAAIRADQRKSPDMLFFAEGFNRPLLPSEASPYREALEMVRLAPSSGNSQPWRVVRDKSGPVYHFYMNKAKALYYKAGLHHIDLGIAMCHFALAAKELGLSGAWRYQEPGLGSLPPDTVYIMSWIGA